MDKRDFSSYYATEDGKIFNNDGSEVNYFNSNGYYQCILKDNNNKSHTMGVHAAVAMFLLPNWYDGCVVHHRDEDRHNNAIDNLEVESRSQHSRNHVTDTEFIGNYVKEHGPANKGKHPSEESRQKMSIAAKVRYQKLKESGVFKGDKPFFGNQFIDKNGNRRTPKSEERKDVHTMLPMSVFKKLMEFCEKEHQSVSEVIRQSIIKYIE